MATTYSVGAGDMLRPLGKVRIKHFPEDASQTFKIGEVLIQGAATLENKVKVAAINPTAAIVGVAAEAASGTTGNMVAVWCADPNTHFIVRTVASDGLDYSDIGTARALQTHATLTTTWVVDTTDAGNDSVVVLYYRSPTGAALAEGDFEMEAIVRFVRGATIWGSET